MAQITTYKNDYSRGVYSQLKLDGGDKIFISIAMTSVKVSKLNFLNFPTTTIWESTNISEAKQKFMGSSGADSFGLLNAVIRYLDNCNSIEEVKVKLSKN